MADLEEWLAKRKGRTSTAPTRSILSGDLHAQNLAEVFRQVIGTGQEGILRLFSPVEDRDLYFSGTRVQVFAPSRPGKRLGECLVHLKILDKEQLDEALKLQKILYKPLGVILLEKGFATQHDIDKVAEYQAREELYALFTWHSGRFEFFQQERREPDMVARLEVMPAFEVSEVLAEVDKRQARWQRFLHSLHSLEDVFVAADKPEPEAMTDEHRALRKVLDEGRSVRDAADETVYSVFDCARLMTDMLGWGIVERLDAKGMLRVATGQLAQGQPRRAALTLQTLLQRGQLHIPDPDTAVRIAELLLETETPRLAALALAHAARLCEDPEEALIRARRAIDLDDRCAEALRCLRELLAVHGEDPEELFQISYRLADAASDEGDNEEALAILENLVAERPGDIDLLQRNARVLLRLDRRQEASDVLLRTAGLVESQGTPERASALYSQVLGLDPKCRQASMALLRLRFRLKKEHIRFVAIGAAALLALLIGLPMFLGSDEPPERPVVRNRATANQDQNRARIRQLLLAAKSSLRENDFQAAVAAWRDARKLGAGPELAESARTSITPLLPKLEALREHLRSLTSQSEDPLESARSRDTLMKELGGQEHVEELAAARAVQQVRDDELLKGLLGEADRDRLVQASDDVLEALAAAEEIRQQYLREMSLDPLIEKAIRHEESYEFREAMETYRRLLTEHPGDGDIREHFRGRVSLYERVLAELEEMNRAVDEYDYAEARKSLTRLQRLDPQIPFAQLTRLPILVDSRPPGARVFLNGDPVGETPARATYTPGGELVVQWRKAGFEPLAREYAPDRERVTAVMTKLPDWKAEIRGTLEQAPVCDEDGRVFISDRTGRITALSTDTGGELWSEATGDLSGLLPRPLIHRERLIVASLDGRLRAFDKATGKRRWHVDGLRCESAPTLCGDTLLLVTDDGRIVALSAKTGEEHFRLSLSASPVGRLRALDRDRVVLATNAGEAVCISARDGAVLWRTRVGSGCSQPPGVGSGRIAAVSDDGRLVLLGADGSKVWQREGLLAPSAPPAVIRGFVLVPEGHLLRSYRLADGKPGPQRETGKTWTAEPVAGAGHLLIGDRDGNVEVLNPDTLELRYRIRGDSALRAAPAIDGKGRVVVAFEDRQVFGFLRLP